MRELSHVVERAVLMARGDAVTADDLGLQRNAPPPPAPPAPDDPLEDLDLERREKRMIERAMARYGGNAVLAAQALGLSRSAFYRRAKNFGL